MLAWIDAYAVMRSSGAHHRLRPLRQPDPLRLVAAVEDRLPPRAVVDIPAHGLAQPALERLRGAPAELALDLGWIDGIAPIMPGPVGHEGDEPLARAGRRGRDLVEQRADRLHHLD